MDEKIKDRLQRLANERQGLLREMEAARAALTRELKTDGGVIYFTVVTPAQDLLQRCYNDGWVDPGFDWMRWVQSEEGTGLFSAQTKRQAASMKQIGHLLTAIARQDRFSHGAWAEAVRSGLLRDVIERAGTLTEL